MTTYQVTANTIEMNIEAKNVQEARNIFAQTAGYADEQDMEERLGTDSEIEAVEV